MGLGVHRILPALFAFAIPFLLLLSRRNKRDTKFLKKMAMWYSLSVPSSSSGSPRRHPSGRLPTSLARIAAPIGIGGICTVLYLPSEARPLLFPDPTRVCAKRFTDRREGATPHPDAVWTIRANRSLIMELPDKAPENLSKQPGQEDAPMTMKENVIPDHTRPQGSTVAPSGRDHEYTDISFKSIIRFAVVLVVLALTSHLLLLGLRDLRRAQRRLAAVPHPMAAPLSSSAPAAGRRGEVSTVSWQEARCPGLWLARPQCGVARIRSTAHACRHEGLSLPPAPQLRLPRQYSTRGVDSAAPWAGTSVLPLAEQFDGRFAGDGPGEGRRPLSLPVSSGTRDV